jgi:hypothetical protein
MTSSRFFRRLEVADAAAGLREEGSCKGEELLGNRSDEGGEKIVEVGFKGVVHGCETRLWWWMVKNGGGKTRERQYYLHN